MSAIPTITPKPCKRGHLAGRYGNGTCKECQRVSSAAQYRANPEKIKNCKRAYYINNPKQILLNAARERARKGGYICTLTVRDIVITEFCPLLGIKIERSTNGQVLPSSPSLDKIRPELGYIPGNVWVISHRANSIKSNATLPELQKIVEGLQRVLS